MSSGYADIPSSGGIQSINGDVTSAQVIAAGSGITVVSAAGTTTITSGSSSFASGSVIFSNGTILTQDNTNFKWDNTGKALYTKSSGVNTTDFSEIVPTGGTCIFVIGTGSSRLGYQPGFSGFLAVTGNGITGYVASVGSSTEGLVLGTYSNHSITFRIGNANLARITTDGQFWVAPYAITTIPTEAITGIASNNSTSIVNDVLCARFDGSGGAASSGIGAGLTFKVNTSTTFAINSGQVASGWSTVTHASRIGFVTISAYDAAAAREGLRVSTSGSAAQIGFLGAAAVIQQASGANLTNNVTSGGTNDIIADYNDLTVYANDAAAIRNDIYQLARKLKQVNDALRLYGLLT